jgi:hypothetical protein
MKEAVRLPFQCNPIHLTTGMVKALLQNGQKEVVPLFRSEGSSDKGFPSSFHRAAANRLMAFTC